PYEVYGLLDTLCMVSGVVVSVWLVLFSPVARCSLTPVRLVCLVGFWLLLTHLALPPLPQLISRSCLPVYVFRRPGTVDGPLVDLYLLGRRHDFTYQQEVGGTTTKRHHVRFWRMPKDFVLPGGYRADWLAAGTYDRAVGFSFFTLQVTHRIDENIDVERDY